MSKAQVTVTTTRFDQDEVGPYERKIGILIAHGNWEEAKREVDRAKDELSISKPQLDWRTATIAETNIGVRLAGSLETHLGILMVRDLAGVTSQHLELVPNLGKKGIEAIKIMLVELGAHPQVRE